MREKAVIEMQRAIFVADNERRRILMGYQQEIDSAKKAFLRRAYMSVFKRNIERELVVLID